DNIPAIVTPFFGRETELNALDDMLADPVVRLITLVGLGGIGKTRLALEIAWRHADGKFKDGITFVQLAALQTEEQLAPAIALALHLPLSAADEQGPHQELINYLRPKQALLVFDNCEHLLDGIILAAEILEAAPQLKILATSRERLRLRAEHLFPLRGLPYGEQADHPAARLFEGTARRIKPDFRISATNKTYVNRLCRLVDGLPLALELAAGSLDRASVAALADEIEDSLDVLASDLRDIPARHRSLRVVLESTWNRLQPQTRRIFAALSVFRGSFTSKAAYEVAEASPELLQQLVLHSLLGFDSETGRYEMHEMLRQFAANKLAADPAAEQAANRRHGAFYADMAQLGREAMRGGDQAAWMARLQREGNNISKAISWTTDHDIVSAANIAMSMHAYWVENGQMREGTRQYARLLPFQVKLPPNERGWLLTYYAEMLLTQGATDEPVALVWEALPRFWETADSAGAAYVYLLMSRISRRISDDIQVSIQIAETGLQQALEADSNHFLVTLLLESLSDSLFRSGDFDRAATRIEQGLTLSEARGNQIAASYLRAIKTAVLSHRGDFQQSNDMAEENLFMARQLGMLYLELLALEALGLNALAQGRLEVAKQYLADDHALCKEANYRPALAASAINLGDVFRAEKAYPNALAFYSESLAIFQSIGSQNGVVENMERLAQWAWETNRPNPQPVRWLACSLKWLEQRDEARSPIDEARVAALREDINARLNKECLAQAWSEGERMTIEEALAEMVEALPIRAPASV
ncbi:MAG: ATP-binding protein, partial [Candidatus Promineifilaceae bacterium]